MAKHTVTEFGIEVQFSEKVMAGLTKLEGNVMKAAVTMERALNRAFKTNGAKVMEETLGKIVRDTNNASRQMKKALTDAFDIKNAGRSSVRGFETDAKSAAKRVAKHFRDSMKFDASLGSAYGRGRRGNPPVPPTGGGGGNGGRGGLSFIDRQNRWMESHNVRTTENGMTNTMSRLGLHTQLGAFRESMNQVLTKYKGTGNTREYERESRRVINSYKDLVHGHKEYQKALERGKFMQHSFNDSVKNMATGMVSLFTIVEGFKMAVKAGRERQETKMATEAVFSENSKDPTAALKARVWAAGFGRQIGQSAVETTRQLTSFTASAAPAMGVQGSQNFYQNAATYGRLHGLNRDRMSHAMLAFEQMASKGQVSAEELKGQLAEAMPGSEQLFAKAMYGDSSPKSLAKLLDDMKNGLLKAEVVLPKVSAEMAKQNEAAGGLAKVSAMTGVALDNVTADMEIFFASIYEGMDKGLGRMARSLASMFHGNAALAQDFGALLGWVFDKLSDVVDLITTIGMNIHWFFGMLRIWFRELDPETQKFLKVIGSIVDEMAGGVLQLVTVLGSLKLAMSTLGFAGKLFGMGKGVAVAAEAGAAGAAAGGAAATGGIAALGGLTLGTVAMVAAAAYMIVKPLADSIFDPAINAHGQKTLAGGNIIADSYVGKAWQGGIDLWHGLTGGINDALHTPLVSGDSPLAGALNRTITIPPNAFNNVVIPPLKGIVTLNIPMPDGTTQSQTVELMSDHQEASFMNVNPMGGGWQSQSSNVGWQNTGKGVYE